MQNLRRTSFKTPHTSPFSFPHFIDENNICPNMNLHSILFHKIRMKTVHIVFVMNLCTKAKLGIKVMWTESYTRTLDYVHTKIKQMAVSNICTSVTTVKAT